MTEPVAGATSPRRTVRVAVALVAGQAVLGAVLGWMTFGPSESPPPVARAADPLVEPIVVPTASIRLPPMHVPPTTPSVRPSKTASAPRASRSSRPPAVRPKSKAPSERPRTVMAPEESPVQPLPPDPDLAGPPPSPKGPDDVQDPVVAGERCEPAGATGRTADDVELRCVRDDDGDLVWQIN